MENHIPKDKAQYQIPDKEIVHRILDGEKELYELLLRRYNQKLYRAVRSYLSDEDEIEEAMQQTYINAYEKLYQFQWNAEFSTWLIRIGIHQALARLREKGRTVSLFTGLNDREQDVFQIADTNQMTPEKKTIFNETRQLLEKAVDLLPEKYRVVYILKEVEGMDNREIAHCLTISESNVKVRAHRSKLMLKEHLYALSADHKLFEFGNARCDRLVNRVMTMLPKVG